MQGAALLSPWKRRGNHGLLKQQNDSGPGERAHHDLGKFRLARHVVAQAIELGMNRTGQRIGQSQPRLDVAHRGNCNGVADDANRVDNRLGALLVEVVTSLS